MVLFNSSLKINIMWWLEIINIWNPATHILFNKSIEHFRSDFLNKIEMCIGKTNNNQKSNTLTLSNEFMKKNDEMIVKFLLERWVVYIDISQLNRQNLSRINHILTSNFPLLEIQRLIPGDKLININISGIKQINDIAGQDFCDTVILKFKEFLKKNFTSSNDANPHKSRVVKDDYKNLTFVTDNKEPLKMIFGNITSKTQMVQNIMKSLENEILQNSRKLIQSKIDKNEIVLKNDIEFEKLVTKKVNQIQSVVMNYFDFGVWQSTLALEADNVSKLDSIRKAEISSRVWITKTDKIEIKPFTQKEMISYLEMALENEKMILEKYKDTQFIFDGIPYNVVIQTTNGPVLSTELLRYVRKYPDAIIPKELSILVKKYISSLNNSLDFISPIKYELISNGREFEFAKKIDLQIRSWMVESKYVLHNHKWWFTKKAFFEFTNAKSWIKIFIDIKDMGIDNLVDFQFRAKHILKLYTDLKNWNLDVQSYEKLTQKLFLEAGKSVSDKFLEVQKRISKKYPDAVMSFGGDEIFLFIPEKKIQFQKEIEMSITEILAAAGQKARVVIDISEKTFDTKESFSKLEQITKLSKIVEETIEKQLTKKWYILNGNLPDNTYIKIEPSTRLKIMKKGFHLDDFFKKVYTQIQNIDFTIDMKKSIILWQIENNISMTISRNLKNEVEIYLHN